MQKIDYWLLTFFAVLRPELAKILPDVTRIYDKKFALAILVPQNVCPGFLIKINKFLTGILLKF